MTKFLKVDFIWEITPYYMAIKNVRLEKAYGSWRICVDFIDLNKICLKDCYHLLNVDKVVNEASSFVILSFCDTFLWYNQILMWLENQESFNINEDVHKW